MKLNRKILAGALLLAGFLATARGADVASGASAAPSDEATSSLDHMNAVTDHLKLHFHGRPFDSDEHNHVSVGHNQTVPAGEQADNVVSVLASANVAGDVAEDVVTVLGNSHVTGSVDGDAVAVLGNVYIDSRVNGDVVSVLGNVELGPHADVGGEISAVGGTVVRDPAAVTHGNVEIVSGGDEGFDFGWLQRWVTTCLLKGRLLAFSPGVGWAWTIALVSLLFYALAALGMRRSVEKYVGILENHPGESVIAAFLTLVGTPILFILLLITMIGVLAIPFLGLALLLIGSFGRIVMFAWLGSRLLKPMGNEAWTHPAVAVLIGGLIVTVLYTVPVVGMITFQLIGFLGMGVVVYGLLLALRNRRQLNGASPQPAAGPQGAAPAAQDAAHVAEATPFAAAPATNAASEGGAPAGAAAPATAAAASLAAVGYPRAGFWIRMLALFIDLALVGILMHIILHTGHLQLLVVAIYGAVMWKIKGSTVGGIICHLQVVRADGRELDWTTAIVRALSCFLSFVFLGLGFIWIAIDRDRQGWHDKIAGTIVVRAPKVAPLLSGG